MDKRSKIDNQDLLSMLDGIVDFVVGNESPEEVSFTDHGTLPSVFAYLTMNPNNQNALNEAKKMISTLEKRIEEIKKSLTLMQVKIDIKKKNI